MRFLIIVLLLILSNNVLAAKKISELTDLTTGLQGADDMMIRDNSASTAKKVGLDVLRPFFNSMYDTNSSNVCVPTWNEDDTSDRVLNFKVNGGDRTLDLSENLTLADGYNFTLTAEDTAGSIVLDEQTLEIEGEGTATRLFKIVNGQDEARTLTFHENVTVSDGAAITLVAEDTAGSITLDEQTFEVEGEGTATRLMKLVNASDAAATLTIDGTSGKVDQDVSSTGTPSFDQSNAAGNVPVLTLDQADIDKDFIKLIGTATSGDNTGSIVQSGDASTPTIEGYLKIYVQDDGNVLTDGAYYIPLYSINN